MAKPMIGIAGEPGVERENLEIVDVEFFPEREWDGKTAVWQLSGPNGAKHWLFVNREFIEMMTKLPRNEADCNCNPTSIEFLK